MHNSNESAKPEKDSAKVDEKANGKEKEKAVSEIKKVSLFP